MGQGNSTNPKEPVQKSDSSEQVEQIESNEEDDQSSRLGSLKKNKWLPRKQSEDKTKKPKKTEKKKKKKDEQEEVSSATCISDADRASLRHSRIELHLEECQPAPDEDDAISLSSCGEDPRKNLKDIESEEPTSLLICDYSSSNMTASPGESLSSGQDSGFARGNTIRSVSSEEEHTATNVKNKENSSEIDTKLITTAVEVTEKCKDYIEKSYPFNSCSPISSPENSIVEEQTEKTADSTVAESNLKPETTFSTSTVPSPKLETQTSLTETPEIASQTEETSVVEDQTKNTDESLVEPSLGQEDICDTISTSTVSSPKLETQSSLTETPEIASKTEETSVVEDQTKNTDDSPVESSLGQENICDTISTSTVSSPKLETQSSLTETPEVESQTKVIKDSDLVTGMVKDLVNETLESAVEYLTHEYKKMNKSEINEVHQQEPISEDIKVEETVDKELNLTAVTEVTEITEVTEVTDVTDASGLEEKSIEINEISDLPLPEPFQEKVSGEGIDNKDSDASICTEKTDVDVIIVNREVKDSLIQELAVEDISVGVEDISVGVEDISVEKAPLFVNDDNVEIIERMGDFEELGYSLKVKPVSLLESLTEEPEDKSEKDVNANEVEILKEEIEVLQNCDSNVPNDSLLSTESESSADNSMKYEVPESLSFNSPFDKQNISDSDIIVEMIQNEEVCPSEILITTDLDADDSGINNSGESLPPYPAGLSDESMTETSKILEEMPSFELPPPEIITLNEVQENCTDSSSTSASSTPSTKELKEPKDPKGSTEQSSTSTTQPIPDSTTGAVFV